MKPKSFYRAEALEHRSRRLDGVVSLATPFKWQVMIYGGLASVIAAIAYGSMASFSSVQQVDGEVTIDQGVLAIVATRPGTVIKLPVQDGSPVKNGQVLLEVATIDDTGSGPTAERRIASALEEQDLIIKRQIAFARGAAVEEEARLRGQAKDALAQVPIIDRQIQEQAGMIHSAQEDLRAIQGVVSRGFVSRRDLRLRETDLAQKRTDMLRLQQGLMSKKTEAAVALRSASQAKSVVAGQVEALEASRMELRRQTAQSDISRGYVLRAPFDGFVTAVSVKVGEAVATANRTMLIVPRSGRRSVVLAVPSAAIGFIRAGQNVSMAIDAFPYQNYGTVAGRVRTVALAAKKNDGTPQGPTYLVNVDFSNDLDDNQVRDRLIAGMTLKARIVTERRTLLNWLLEPIYSVGRR